MNHTSTNPEQEIAKRTDLEEVTADELESKAARDRVIARLRLLWDRRRFLFRVVGCGLVVSTLVAFLMPKRYQATARLMPPDNQSASGLAAAAAALSGRVGGLGAIAGDLLGLKSTSALFVGILRSRSVQDRLIQKFDLKKIYWTRRIEDAREDLEDHTKVFEDRKSGIITVTVIDKSPQRAAAMAQAYVDELNRLVAELTTSSAHRERVFLEDRLRRVKQGLEAAEKDFSQFASENTAIDIKEQGRAMVEAAASLQGQLIAAQAELEGLRQIYTDNNVRVRAVRARVSQLQYQLEKLGGETEDAPAGSGQEKEPLYPSIRKLPLLGVTYADLLRRAKVQEAVFETLTQEYELAKVEEAKEIPIVKVLDAPTIPEKKSFPPRFLIVFLGTVLSAAFGFVWILGMARWEETDSQDPGKVFVKEILETVKARSPWLSPNGSGLRAMTARGWGKLGSQSTKPRETGDRS